MRAVTTPRATSCVGRNIRRAAPLHASVDVSRLARELKAPSSGFLRRYFRVPGFAWQTGYGAFSVRRGDVPRVLDYLREQPRHHAEGTLLEALEETPSDTA